MPSVVALDRQPVKVWAPQMVEIMQAVDHVAYVAGGAARQIVMANHAPPAEDIDLFLFEEHTYPLCREAVARLDYTLVSETPQSSTYQHRDWLHSLPVQVIRPSRDRWSSTYGSPAEVLSHFSFTTEQFAIVDGDAYIGEHAVDDTKDRRLVLNNITDPLHVAMRAVKYGAKGYSFDQESMLRIFEEWGDRRG